MPENVQHQNDRPLEAPSLLELSAHIVANNVDSLLLSGKHLPNVMSQQPCSSRLAESRSSSVGPLGTVSHGQTKIVGLRDPAAEQALIQHQTCGNKQQPSNLHGFLPLRASEAVLNKFCEKWEHMQQSGRDLSPEEIDIGLQVGIIYKV